MVQLFECCLPEQETSLRLCSASSDRARRECVFNDRICSTTEMTWQLKNCLLRGASSPASSFAVPPPALLSCGINSCLSCCKESRLKLLTQQKQLPPVWFTIAFTVQIGYPMGRGCWNGFVLTLETQKWG